LSPKEAKRVFILEKMKEKDSLSVTEASFLLELSERHIYRVKEVFEREGIKGLAHKGRGKRAHNRTPDQIRNYIIELAVEIAPEASCKHIAEMLEADRDYEISAKTVGRILKKSGIPLSHSHRTPKGQHPSRERMPFPGLLVQIDASPFNWLGPLHGELHLHGAIDDATSNILALWLDGSENCNAYLHIMKRMLERWGVPERVYTDRHGIFFPVNPKSTMEEELEGIRSSLSQFGKIMERLGVNQIKAYTPQAKGRIERLWGTLQHRLVVDLRRENITSIKEANIFLPEYIERFNRRFGVKPKRDISAFKPSPSAEELDLILVKEHVRKADKGSRISYGGIKYQLIDKRDKIVALKPRSPVSVLISMNGHLSARKEDKYFSLKEFKERPGMETEDQVTMKKEKTKNNWKPPKNHPWRIQGIKKLAMDKEIEENGICEWTGV